jgi:holo-[acyl-carrier protein] synthase
MTIVALGMDLVQVERIRQVLEKRGAAFLERIFSADERADCPSEKAAPEFFAGRFAVKEAVLKVLGTGWGTGVNWLDIEVQRQPGGAPGVRLSGAAAQVAEQRGIAQVHVTITHDGGMAAAMAVGEK